MMNQFCDGVTRRDFLRVGTASLFGLGLGLPQTPAPAAAAKPPTRRTCR